MENQILSFFESYADALLTFSAEEISSFYRTPMAVYSDQGVQVVKEDGEVVAFWSEGVKPYAAQKINKAIPEVLNTEKLTNTILMCKVKWTNYDEKENKVGEETNFYILSHIGEGLKINGLIII